MIIQSVTEIEMPRKTDKGPKFGRGIDLNKVEAAYSNPEAGREPAFSVLRYFETRKPVPKLETVESALNKTFLMTYISVKAVVLDRYSQNEWKKSRRKAINDAYDGAPENQRGEKVHLAIKTLSPAPGYIELWDLLEGLPNDVKQLVGALYVEWNPLDELNRHRMRGFRWRKPVAHERNIPIAQAIARVKKVYAKACEDFHDLEDPVSSAVAREILVMGFSDGSFCFYPLDVLFDGAGISKCQYTGIGFKLAELRDDPEVALRRKQEQALEVISKTETPSHAEEMLTPKQWVGAYLGKRNEHNDPEEARDHEKYRQEVCGTLGGRAAWTASEWCGVESLIRDAFHKFSGRRLIEIAFEAIQTLSPRPSLESIHLLSNTLDFEDGIILLNQCALAGFASEAAGHSMGAN